MMGIPSKDIATARLQVRADGMTYTYEAEIASDPIRVEELRDGRIEAETMTLELYTSPKDGDLDDSFLFFDSPADVGAALSDLGGDFSFPARVIWDRNTSSQNPDPESSDFYQLRGRVERAGVQGQRISRTDETCLWTIDVESVAERILEEALEAIDLTAPSIVADLQDAGLYYTIPTWVRPQGAEDELDPTDPPDALDELVDIRWWDSWDLMQWCLDEVGSLASTDLAPPWKLDVEHVGGGDAETYTRTDIPVGLASLDGVEYELDGNGEETQQPDYSETSTTLPPVTALDLWRDLIDLHGWIVRVEHSAYPSTSIRLTTRDASLPDEGSVDVSALSRMSWTDGYDLHHEDDTPDFALSYLNAPRSEDAYPEGAKYAALQRRLDRDGQPYNLSLREVPYRLPRFRSASDWTATFQDGDYTEEVRGLEAIIRRDEETDTHLAELYDDAGTMRVVLLRVVDQPGASQSPVVGAIYMRERYPAHAIHKGSVRVLEGRADLVAYAEDTQLRWSMRPGSYAGDLANFATHAHAHEGLPWVPQLIEHDYRRDTVEMRLVYPHPVTLQSIQDPDAIQFDRPDSNDVSGEKETEYFVDDQGRYLIAVWEVRVSLDIDELPSGVRKESRTLQGSGGIVLTPGDMGTNLIWSKTWEADDPENPPFSPPSDPSEYTDSDTAQVRLRDTITGETTDYSTPATPIDDLGSSESVIQ